MILLWEKKKKPFNTILVANRDKIAARIIRTLKKLKIKSVSVYSDPDKHSQNVIESDIAVPLYGSIPSETYLDINKIIKAVKKTNTDAIIPGYGFLSENADFSNRCTKGGIVFIGPTGEIIRKLGLKYSARKIAADANVPLIPDSPLITDSNEAKITANKIGYPIMIKSTAESSDIGLRKVDNKGEIEEIFHIIQHQRKSYFGNAGVFIEKFIKNTRHVEV